MSVRRMVSLAILATLVLVAAPTSISVARADAPTPAPISEAAKRFQRGVQLYNEADYHGALVEFRRAYELAPNPTVLYNIGQTYYQLQNYAAALTALGRYLTEAGPSAPHRREVEQTIDTLQSRVGKVALTSSTPGLDVTIDDELIGKTPFDEPILVSIGRRKVTALRDGRPVENRYIDVAAGDTVKLSLSAGSSEAQPAGPGSPTPATSGSSNLGWWVTGGLGVVMIASATGAYLQSRSLDDERKSPVAPSRPNGAQEKRDALDSKGKWVTALSLTADISAVLAIVVGAVTLKYSLSESSTHQAHLLISPTGFQIAGRF